MSTPEEDLPPRWLREYGAIDADISRMEEFAARLRAEVVDNYAPHLEYINEDMSVQLPPVPAAFVELHSFLLAHRETMADTNELVHHFRDATGGFATAAAKVSADYGRTDAFTAVRVGEIEAALDRTAAARPAPTAPGGPEPYPSEADQ